MCVTCCGSSLRPASPGPWPLPTFFHPLCLAGPGWHRGCLPVQASLQGLAAEGGQHKGGSQGRKLPGGCKSSLALNAAFLPTSCTRSFILIEISDTLKVCQGGQGPAGCWMSKPLYCAVCHVACICTAPIFCLPTSRTEAGGPCGT